MKSPALANHVKLSQEEFCLILRSLQRSSWRCVDEAIQARICRNGKLRNALMAESGQMIDLFHKMKNPLLDSIPQGSKKKVEVLFHMA